MAITKVFAIRSRFEKTVQYAANEEKTSLSGIIEYAVNPDKTEKRLFESCLNCESVENAARDMERTKRRYNKTGGIQGYHIIQSFQPGEITPEQTHAIGVEFARRLFGDRFEVVVGTHLDKHHLHNVRPDSVVIHREPDGGSDLTIRNWTDVIAVFAVKTAGADADATDVVTIDEERIDLIRQVFWDMNEVSWYVQTIKHKDDTETILHITITSKKATEMPDFYHFSKSQREALTEVLKPEYAQMLAELVGTYGGEVSLDEAQIRAMLSAMPKDISERRKAVVEKAYSLLGKVNYFWGGKSSAIGWDSRWGTPTRVTAPGSRSTGTVRPYGLDCSGFVDWVFNNSLEYVIGHGGGAASQHGYCKPISWSEALPGDLVFYPGDSHVGIFVGKDESGNPLIIHCASSQNNVVLTGLQGFTRIGRPDCF